jgi:hypothetical protein
MRNSMPAAEPQSRADDEVTMSRLEIAVPARVGPGRAAAVLGPGRAAWLGDAVAEASGGGERHLVDLELRVSDRLPRVAFRKAALVEVGTLRHETERAALQMDISWRAAGMSPIFPVFAGTLTWAGSELRVAGRYAPPGGSAGVVADRLVLHVAARGTARRLLEKIAEVMERGAA